MIYISLERCSLKAWILSLLYDILFCPPNLVNTNSHGSYCSLASFDQMNE